jgi:antitoxin HicB
MASELYQHPAAAKRGMSSSARQRALTSVEHYASLPYHLLLVRDSDDKGKPWTASVEELPGCTSRGSTSEEALSGIREAMTGWIAAALQEGREIPEPKSATSHSGRLLLRMPRTLHADLTRASEREGVSLNQFITDVLASAVAWRGGGFSYRREEIDQSSARRRGAHRRADRRAPHASQPDQTDDGGAGSEFPDRRHRRRRRDHRPHRRLALDG